MEFSFLWEAALFGCRDGSPVCPVVLHRSQAASGNPVPPWTVKSFLCQTLLRLWVDSGCGLGFWFCWVFWCCCFVFILGEVGIPSFQMKTITKTNLAKINKHSCACADLPFLKEGKQVVGWARVLLQNTAELQKGGSLKFHISLPHLLEAAEPFGFSRILMPHFPSQRAAFLQVLLLLSRLIVSGNPVPASFTAQGVCFQLGFSFIYMPGDFCVMRSTHCKCWFSPNTCISVFCFPVIPLYPQIWVTLEKYG